MSGYKTYLFTIILLNTLMDIKSYPSGEPGRKSQKVPPFNHRLYVHSSIITPNHIKPVIFAFYSLSAPPFCDRYATVLSMLKSALFYSNGLRNARLTKNMPHYLMRLRKTRVKT